MKQENEVSFSAGVSALLFHAASKWFFCGLLDGLIKAYRQDPVAEANLQGHTGAVAALLLHEDVLLSGSEDCSVCACKYDAACGAFQCATTVASTVGPVFALHVDMTSAGLWVGGHQGISCVSLQTMQSSGSIASPAQVVALLPYESCVIAAYGDGVVKVFDAGGKEQFSHGPVGEHTTNTAVTIMRHPVAGKMLLLCGQELGYITAYDLPEFRPRGTFSTGYQGDVTAIVDMGADGLFFTCSFSGDVILWRWERDGSVGFIK